MEALCPGLDERRERGHLVRLAPGDDIQVEQQARPVAEETGVSVPDVDVPGGERRPEALGIFDLEQEPVFFLKGEYGVHIDPQILPHFGGAVAVDRGDDDLEARVRGGDFSEHGEKLLVYALEGFHPVLRDEPPRLRIRLPVIDGCRIKDLVKVEPVSLPEVDERGRMHRREEKRVLEPPAGFKVKLRQVHAVPVERPQERPVFRRHRADAGGVGQRDRVPP